jgi:hypothetical protein
MKFQYNLIFENKKHEQKYTKSMISNNLTFLMVMLQNMLSPAKPIINSIKKWVVYKE